MIGGYYGYDWMYLLHLLIHICSSGQAAPIRINMNNYYTSLPLPLPLTLPLPLPLYTSYHPLPPLLFRP